MCAGATFLKFSARLTDTYIQEHMTEPDMLNIVTTKEVAHFLRLTESTICKLVAQGRLPGFKIGDSWRFDMDEIMEQIHAAKTSVKKTRVK